jgi:hypothetical protein
MVDENTDSSSSDTATNLPAEDVSVFQIPVNLPTESTLLEVHEYFADSYKDLQKELLKVAPVVGISGAGPDIRGYRLDIAPDATTEQIAAASETLRRWPETYTRLLAERAERKELEDWFSAKIAAGFTAPAGYRLELTPTVVPLILGNYMMAQQAVAAGAPVPPLLDADGMMHFFNSIADLTDVMLAYGQYRTVIAADYAAKKADIDARYAEDAVVVTPEEEQPSSSPDEAIPVEPESSATSSASEQQEPPA